MCFVAFHDMDVIAIEALQCYCNEVVASDAQKRNQTLILPTWVLATRDVCDVSALRTPTFGEHCTVALREKCNICKPPNHAFPGSQAHISECNRRVHNSTIIPLELQSNVDSGAVVL